MKDVIFGVLIISLLGLVPVTNSQETFEKLDNITIDNFNVDTFIDSRDGKKYSTIKIGNQIWMAENLAFYADSGCWVYDNDSIYLSKYGYLYNFETALNVSPEGWHLPNDKEWHELIEYLKNQNGSYIQEQSWWKGMGYVLKSESGWYNGGDGNNSYGFNAVPGGFYKYKNNSFYFGGKNGYYWSRTSNGDKHAWTFNFFYLYDSFHRNSNYKVNGFSIRCVKD